MKWNSCYVALVILTLLCYGCIGIQYPKQTIAIEAYDEFGTFINPNDLKVLVFSKWRTSVFTTIFYQDVRVLNVSNSGLVEGVPKFDTGSASNVVVLVFTQNSYAVNISDLLGLPFSSFSLYKSYPNHANTYPFVVTCLPRRDAKRESIYRLVSSVCASEEVQTGDGVFFPDSSSRFFKLGKLRDWITEEEKKYLLEKFPWEDLSKSVVLDGSLLTLLLSRFNQYYSYEGETTPSVEKNIIKFAIKTLYRTNVD